MNTDDDLFADNDADEPQAIEELPEFTEEPTETDEQADQQGEIKSDEDEADSKKAKTKRVVRNPQPKLNNETLKGPRGLLSLQSYFDRVKFKGKGHEQADLSVILKTYEYWCHRLFPKFKFDDCIARIESLGNKKEVKNYVKRIRMGLEGDNESVPNPENDDENDDETAENHNENDPEENAEPQTQNNDLFDSLVGPRQEENIQIDAEMQERIRLNRERAERIRRERLQKIQSAAGSSPGEPSGSSNFAESSSSRADEFPLDFEELIPVDKAAKNPSSGEPSRSSDFAESNARADEFPLDSEELIPLDKAANNSSQTMDFENDDIDMAFSQIDEDNLSQADNTQNSAAAVNQVEEEASIEDLLDTINQEDGLQSQNSSNGLTEHIPDSPKKIDDIQRRKPSSQEQAEIDTHSDETSKMKVSHDEPRDSSSSSQPQRNVSTESDSVQNVTSSEEADIETLLETINSTEAPV